MHETLNLVRFIFLSVKLIFNLVKDGLKLVGGCRIEVRFDDK